MNFPVDPFNEFHVCGMHENTGILFIPLPLPWMRTAEKSVY